MNEVPLSAVFTGIAAIIAAVAVGIARVVKTMTPAKVQVEAEVIEAINTKLDHLTKMIAGISERTVAIETSKRGLDTRVDGLTSHINRISKTHGGELKEFRERITRCETMLGKRNVLQPQAFVSSDSSPDGEST